MTDDEKTPMPDEVDPSVDEQPAADRECSKPFVEHLDDLRSTIMWCLAFLVIGIGCAVPLTPSIIAWLKAPLIAPLRDVGKNPDTFLVAIKVHGGFMTSLKVMFWGGIIIAAPFIVLSIGRFVFPGLRRKEKGVVMRGGFFALLLFVAGICMGYFVTLPVAFRVMLKINAWAGIDLPFAEVQEYIGFVLKLLLAFGLCFQLPIIVFALGSMGIVTSAQLREKRRHVVVGLLVLGMILTPPDLFTQLLMAAPMILLYEVCIWLTWSKEKGRLADD
jgi:sec-independent protein translocase protein TatC